jgi:hypothetical protein
VAAPKILKSFRDALEALLEEDDGDVEAWSRRAYFEFDEPHTELWDDLDRDAPPKVYRLMERVEDEAVEFLWRMKPGLSLDRCPIVELTRDGETEVLAPNAKSYVGALLYSNGAMGGGSTEDLVDARTEASREARALSEAILDEMEMSLPHQEDLGDAWEDLQEEVADLWADAAEGLE